jgi:hypothetical protein
MTQNDDFESAILEVARRVVADVQTGEAPFGPLRSFVPGNSVSTSDSAGENHPLAKARSDPTARSSGQGL